MAYRQFLILIFSLLSLPAFAFYAGVSPPAAWVAISQSASTGISNAAFRVGAQDAVLFGRTVLTNASLNVGGRAVVMPVAMRFAANAPQIAARAMFVNPALAVGVGAAGVLAAYYLTGDFHPDVANDGWLKKIDAGRLECRTGSSFGLSDWSLNCQVALAAVCAQYKSLQSPVWQSANNFVGTVLDDPATAGRIDVVGPAAQQNYTVVNLYTRVIDETIFQPATPDEFENYPWPLEFPPGVPAALPVPLPIEMPVINPTPLIAPPAEPAPYPLPSPQPMRVPQGDPVEVVPVTSPATYKTPVVDIVPSPTLTDPWRVDVQPKDITKLSADPLPSSEPVPVPLPGDPDAPTVTPKADTLPGLCDLFPNILACAKLGDAPTEDTLQNKNIEVSAAAQSGWGGSGSCPMPRQFVVSGKQIEIPFTLVCDFMTGIKPVFIAAAFLAAALILIGRKGGEA